MEQASCGGSDDKVDLSEMSLFKGVDGLFVYSFPWDGGEDWLEVMKRMQGLRL